MYLIEQLLAELDDHAASFGTPGDVYVTMPQWAYDEIVHKHTGYAPGFGFVEFYTRHGLCTIAASPDDYVTVAAGGAILRCYDPIRPDDQRAKPYVTHCNHKWITIPGLFKEYKNCQTCGAHYEDAVAV